MTNLLLAGMTSSRTADLYSASVVGVSSRAL